MTATSPVRAAGGVVWRRNEDGRLEIVLVHRPAYDDWSFPKGKCNPGESDEDAARREVKEETGLQCHLGAELASSTYINGRGRPKVVRYWAMQVAVRLERLPDDEVDRWLWVADDQAEKMLTYERDLTVLQSLREVID